jgi:fructoselysine-6-P-deglycase FrlB-like protein
MGVPAQLGNLSPLFAEIALKRRVDFERALRGLRWGEMPVYAVGSAATLPAAFTFAYAFEEFLEWPVVVREAGRFLSLSRSSLRTGSALVLVADESPPVAEVVREARRRGARVLAVAAESDVPALAAHETVALPQLPAPGRLAAACLQHAAAGYLALTAARLLKRPQPLLDRLENDWAELPGHFTSAVTRFGDAVRSMGAQLRGRNQILFVGAGLCEPAAQQVAALARIEGHRFVAGAGPAEAHSSWLPAFGRESAAVLLASSQSRARSELPDLARKIKAMGALGLAVTDGNNHDLIREVQAALLLPGLSDMPASILALALGAWLAGSAAAPEPAHRSPAPPVPIQP